MRSAQRSPAVNTPNLNAESKRVEVHVEGEEPFWGLVRGARSRASHTLHMPHQPPSPPLRAVFRSSVLSESGGSDVNETRAGGPESR